MKRLAVVLLLFLAGCAATVDRSASVLAVGDSILAWNRFSGRDIPALVQQQTGLSVSSVAVIGADFMPHPPTDDPGVPSQFVEGDFDWVIFTGGGNDLGKACLQPDAAADILNQLIAPDLSGAYADFLKSLRPKGHKVIIVGYAPVSIRGGPFAGCQTVLETLRDRQRQLAATQPEVFFVDPFEVIAPDDLTAYALDRVHPTPVAGERIAGQIAAIINANP